MMKHWNIKVSGRVQGVFYRASACAEAKKMGITGYAQNQPDGTVYLEAEGKEEPLQKFIEWCKKGPPRAKVSAVDTSSGVLKNYVRFVILK